MDEEEEDEKEKKEEAEEVEEASLGPLHWLLHLQTLLAACFPLLLSLWPSHLILSGFSPSAYCHPFPIPRPPEVLFPQHRDWEEVGRCPGARGEGGGPRADTGRTDEPAAAPHR